MRITIEEKNATKQRIVRAAVALFRTDGFEATTTRDIARASGIATGTLFNYFDTKEAIVSALAVETLSKAHESWAKGSSQGSLEEDLFALVATELRHLKPLRRFIAPFLDTSLSPIVAAHGTGVDEPRVRHLELVAEIARLHGLVEVSPVALQMYWALYVGVLSFWSTDKSPRQEDTLALLDESLNMFAAWLNAP
jgi:AcrR family transcriptional regulator